MKSAIMLLAVGALLVPAAESHAARRIGVAATIVKDVTGSVGGRSGKLSAGDGVFQREIITTGKQSRAQLLFVDQTTFSLGPSSRAVLDRFVYNPKRNAGSVVLSVTRGAFRFVTGTAKPTSYKVRTPVATIGVRGTIFEGFGISLFFGRFVLRQGVIIICPVPGARVIPAGKPLANGCTLIDKPGEYQVTLNGAGPPDNGADDNNDALDNKDDTFNPPTNVN